MFTTMIVACERRAERRGAVAEGKRERTVKKTKKKAKKNKKRKRRNYEKMHEEKAPTWVKQDPI